MAAEKKSTKLVKKANYAFIHKLAAGVSLLAFLVVVIAGLQARASVGTIAIRATVAIIVVALISRVLVRILASYEEMNSGKA